MEVQTYRIGEEFLAFELGRSFVLESLFFSQSYAFGTAGMPIEAITEAMAATVCDWLDSQGCDLALTYSFREVWVKAQADLTLNRTPARSIATLVA
ncbi:hypothetical protein [Leptolyngbya sp. FACHB-261]|uniref:hypothetical protein n=1 Tax=Leptolyngbya sp. FACHB-261 TaxID=2692806 RepID=UPI0016891839|nr:hypothetical protein [Leptolyngbya sp. FACHB-261]MBD2100068.1 hypothetical protein [Leptolyngbya sp. FACHB-261]